MVQLPVGRMNLQSGFFTAPPILFPFHLMRHGARSHHRVDGSVRHSAPTSRGHSVCNCAADAAHDTASTRLLALHRRRCLSNHSRRGRWTHRRTRRSRTASPRHNISLETLNSKMSTKKLTLYNHLLPQLNTSKETFNKP